MTSSATGEKWTSPPVPCRCRKLKQLTSHASVQQRILNTSRYTDDVVRELIQSLSAEPWFARTLIVVNSDHGYNLGEHGGLVERSPRVGGAPARDGAGEGDHDRGRSSPPRAQRDPGTRGSDPRAA